MPIGTVVIDRTPRVLSSDQIRGLMALGRLIEQQIGR